MSPTSPIPGSATRGALGAWPVIVSLLLIAVAPAVQGHAGHSGNIELPGQDDPFATICPPGDSTDPSISAFEAVDAPEPEGPTATYVGCNGPYVVKVTTAETLRPGNSYVAFYSVHNMENGRSLDMPNTLVEQSGAVGANVTDMAADVDGAPGLSAVTLRPASPGELILIPRFPNNVTPGAVAIPVESGQDLQKSGGPGAQIPGFEAALLVGGVLVAALLVGRRGGPPKVLSLLLVAAMVAPAASGASGVLTPEVRLVDGGFTASTDGLNATFTSRSDDPVQLYDFGDFETGEGPDATHAYDRSGLYLVHLISYDPATLQGNVHAKQLTVGDDPANDPPVAVAIASSNWVSYGDTVTLNASGTTEINGDALRYVWTVGKAPVDGSNFTYAVEDVTTDPLWTWTAPQEAGDYVLVLLVLDSRRGFATANTSVRVTETLPDETQRWAFEGTLQCPEQIGANTGQCTFEQFHDLSMAFGGSLTAEMSFAFNRAEAGTDEQGVPDVDIQLYRPGEDEAIKQTTAPGSPKTLEASGLFGGGYQLRVYLDSGADVRYSITTTANYTLDPFV